MPGRVISPLPRSPPVIVPGSCWGNFNTLNHKSHSRTDHVRYLRDYLFRAFARAEHKGQLRHWSNDGFMFHTGLWSRAPSGAEPIFALFERIRGTPSAQVTPVTALSSAA
jgi:hypothetical protein